ncbi:MAG TPA: NAD(+) diphosphatase [Streptosporangiaceae bacterium]
MNVPELRGELALSRSELDRVSERRGDTEWVAKTWDDPATRVFGISTEGKALVDEPTASLVLTGTDTAPDGIRCLLGIDADDVAYFSVVTDALPDLPGTPMGIRQVATLLGARDTGLLTHAVALEYWHVTHGFCPQCGAATEVKSAGSVRVCPVDGSQHFPRVDPAVIMLVLDDPADPADQRCLLGSGTVWASNRYSTLAGFVEPGESLERAVAREVGEEVGVRVTEARYLGSQPWPMPRSLMLGFFALAPDPEPVRFRDGEITAARWFTRTELAEAAASGEIKLPGPISIARHLIETWYGEELPGSW